LPKRPKSAGLVRHTYKKRSKSVGHAKRPKGILKNVKRQSEKLEPKHKDEPKQSKIKFRTAGKQTNKKKPTIAKDKVKQK